MSASPITPTVRPQTVARITLRVLGGMWHATFSGSEGERIARLFGSDTICTPFSDRLLASYVRSQIAALNPDCVVEVVE